MKYIKIIIPLIIIIIVLFLFLLVESSNNKPNIQSKKVIEELREATRIDSECGKEIDISRKEELIDILERADGDIWSDASWQSGKKINFYDKKNKIIYTVTYLEERDYIGIGEYQTVLLKKDKTKFLEILGIINTKE